MATLLDFDVGLTLDGKNLSKSESEELLTASDGLVLIKGKWVEVDREKLSQPLDQWREVQMRGQLWRGHAHALRRPPESLN